MLRGLLAAYLACVAGGDRLLGLAHLAFSDHNHTFCGEHGQVEDLPKAKAPVPETGSTPSTDRIVGGASAFPFAAHTACLFLNGRSVQALQQLTLQPLTGVPASQILDPACPRQDGFHACPPLWSAPKTSPPFAAT